MSTPTPTPPVEPPVTPSAAELPTPKTVPAGTAAKAPLPAHLSALEHTGIPRSVLTWKPRLPSRNWSIFLTIVGSLSYLYFDDRKQCKELKQSYLDKVRHLSEQPMENSLGQPRRVSVYSARWPEDDDAERGMKHFRRYVKPYLVAAAVDYVPVMTPTHGSLARHMQAQVLKKRRQALSLESTEPFLMLPGALTPPEKDAAELEGGSIVVGRHTLKEFVEGLKRGWTGGVDEWDWEKEVKDKLEFDGVFATKPEVSDDDTDAVVPEATVPATPTQPVGALGSLSFLSRPAPNVSINPSIPASAPQTIPSSMHIPPSPLPPQPPLLYVPFVNHLGFKQIPYMIYEFFTERHNVRAGGEAAMALILGSTRSLSATDLDMGAEEESFYKKDFADLPKRTEEARKTYYDGIGPKLIAARQLASGERQLTEEEVKSGKSGMNEWELKEERFKKELRWMGNLDGWNIVRKGEPVHWTDAFDGRLKIFDTSEQGEQKETVMSS